MKVDCVGNLFVIFSLAIFFMLLYVYTTPLYSTIHIVEKENFLQKSHKLLPADKIAIMQGNAIPVINPQRIIFDQCDPAAQSVDGTKDGPKSLFTFAYNKCSPECCVGSPYSCNGGCVCLTDEQKTFFARQRDPSCLVKSETIDT